MCYVLILQRTDKIFVFFLSLHNRYIFRVDFTGVRKRNTETLSVYLEIWRATADYKDTTT